MYRVRRIALCVLTAAVGVAGPAAAQPQVAEIQVLPSDITLGVDSQEIVLAQVFDARGAPIVGADIVWVSSNINVARVDPDPGAPTALITGVGVGIAQVSARVGNVTSIVIVQVQIAQQAQPEPPPPEVRLNTLAAAVGASSRAQVARIEPHNFGFAQPCRVGGFIGSNLLLTTYVAIRGADSVVVILPTGARVAGSIRVAAYDRQADLAVLHVPVQRSGEITVGQDPARTDYVWAVGQPNCQGTTTTPARISDASAPGVVSMDTEMGLGQLGAPLINQDGELVGVVSGGTLAVRATSVQSLANEARRNLAVGSLLTLDQVARAEQHAYGSVALRSEMLGAVARVTPLENWHWPELAQQSVLPLNFAGPIGRYQVELLSAGAVQSSVAVTIQAGLATTLLLAPGAVAAGPQPQPQPGGPQPQPGVAAGGGGGGGGGAIIAVLLGLAAAGGGAALLLAPKEDGGTPPPTGNGTGNGGPTTGTIIIQIPVHN